MRLLPYAFVMAASLFAAPAFAADTYVIDPGHTQVQFSVSRFGFTQVSGDFPDVVGEFTLDMAAPAQSSVHATLQIAGVDSNNPARDKVLLAPPWFDAAQYLSMTFVSTKVEPTSDTTADVIGDLTLHGVTKPVVLKVKLNKIGSYVVTNGTAAGFSADATLKRSDFGMTTAPQFIGDDIVIHIEVLGLPKAK